MARAATFEINQTVGWPMFLKTQVSLLFASTLFMLMWPMIVMADDAQPRLSVKNSNTQLLRFCTVTFLHVTGKAALHVLPKRLSIFIEQVNVNLLDRMSLGRHQQTQDQQRRWSAQSGSLRRQRRPLAALVLWLWLLLSKHMELLAESRLFLGLCTQPFANQLFC
jgi:hypothetical protein